MRIAHANFQERCVAVKLQRVRPGGDGEALQLALPVQFLECDNVGKDLGAYMRASITIPCDLLVCLGAPAHFHRAGWLDVLLEAFLTNGPGLYGFWGYHQPTRHIRTTAFAIPPTLLNAYPYFVNDSLRYFFEHGPESITAFILKSGFPALQVTQLGVFDVPEWHPTSIDESLILDQFTHA